MYTTVVRHLQLQRLAQERWTEETGANLGMPCTTYILLWRTVPSLPVQLGFSYCVMVVDMALILLLFLPMF